MKLIWSFVLYCCVAKVYSGDTINKYFQVPSIWTGWDDAYLAEFQSRFTLIKSISPGVVDEIKNVTTKFRQNYAVCKFFGELEEVFRKDLRAHDHILNVEEVGRFFDEIRKQKPLNDIAELVGEFEDVFSEKLSPEQITHMMKLFGIFEGTPEKIQDSLNYVYGGTTTV